MAKLTESKVYSPVVDDDIKNNLKTSQIWTKCYHETELEEAMKEPSLTCYTIKFDGAIPVQLSNTERIR